MPRIVKRFRHALSLLLALAVLIVALFWIAGAFHQKITPSAGRIPERRSVESQPTGTIHNVTERVVEEVIGTVVAERKTTIASKILATIGSIHVSAGDSVKEGELLIELDDRELRARLEQAREAVTGATASLAKAQSDYERAEDLISQKVISQSEFDHAEAQYKIVTSELARARESEKEATVALSYSKIRAPISGRIVDRLAEPGDTASPGRPLVTLYDPKALRLEAPVRERLATRLQTGDALTIRIDSLNLEIEGRVDEIVPEAESLSRSFLVKVGIPGHAGIYTGMFGRLLIPAGRRRRICIPEAAIQRIGQLDFIEVVDEDGFLERRFVQTGAHSEFGQVELLSGGQPGEKVVLRKAEDRAPPLSSNDISDQPY